MVKFLEKYKNFRNPHLSGHKKFNESSKYKIIKTFLGNKKVLKLKKDDTVIWYDEGNKKEGIFYEYRETSYFIYIPKEKTYVLVPFSNTTIKLDEFKITIKKYNI